MAIPDFQSTFLPLLKACADGRGHTKQELIPLLAELMMDYDLGVSTKEVYTVKQLDSDYFEEE